MDPSNFYLAAAAVLPVLVLTQTVERNIKVNVPNEQTKQRFDRAVDDAFGLGVAVTVLEAALYVLAEFVCLRHLETGRAPIGAWIVWVALGEAAFWVISGRTITERHARAFAHWFIRRLSDPTRFTFLDERDSRRDRPS